MTSDDTYVMENHIQVTADTPSISLSIGSSISCADDVASFLMDRQNEISPKLEKGLSELGFSGEYRLMSGFNEELYKRGIEQQAVFLLVNGELEGDEMAISKVLSPIFAPHSTVLCTLSETRSLIPPDQLEDPDTLEISSTAHGSQNESQPIHVDQNPAGGQKSGEECTADLLTDKADETEIPGSDE